MRTHRADVHSDYPRVCLTTPLAVSEDSKMRGQKLSGGAVRAPHFQDSVVAAENSWNRRTVVRHPLCADDLDVLGDMSAREATLQKAVAVVEASRTCHIS